MVFFEPSVFLVKDLISSMGYPGLAFLMALDATIVPMPSAAVMGFAGALCYEGRYDIALVTAAGAFGSMLGSVSMYLVGLWGGRPFAERYGKYIGLGEERIRTAEGWFKRHGDPVVFICQLVPVAKDLIPFPAGLAKMRLRRFATFSFLGSIPFCFILAYIGLYFGQDWEMAVAVVDRYDLLVLALFVVLTAIYLVHRKRRGRSRERS